MGKGFRMTPSAVHEHASRTSQRGEQISQTGSQSGGAGMHGSALGMVGGSAVSGQQGLVGRFSSAFSQAGSKLEGHAQQLHTSANSVSGTDSDHASALSGIHPSSGNVRNPHASGSAPGMPSSAPPPGGRRPAHAYHNISGTGYHQAGQNAFDQYYPQARPGWNGRPDNLGGRISANQSSAHNPYIPASATQAPTTSHGNLIDPNGPGPSVHAGYGSPQSQQDFLNTQFPNHGNVNPNFGSNQGYGLNCNQCIVGVDAANAGHPSTQAAPMSAGTFSGTDFLRNKYNGTDYQNTNYGAITQKISQEGGAGVVYVSRPPTATSPGSAHVFNVVQHPQYGAVYLDGQTGKLGNLEGGTDRIDLMHYFPDYQPNA